MNISDKGLSQFSKSGLPDWNIEIIEKYPLLYTEHDEDNARHYRQREDKTFAEADFCNLRQGFEFGAGWMNLAEGFSSVAASLVLHLRATVQPDAYIHASIFKQKFDCLHWQGHDNLKGFFSELFQGYVSRIETLSACICEHTGKRCFRHGRQGPGV